MPSLRRAIALEPHHAGYEDLLCRYLLFDQQEPVAAVPHCERATQLNRYFSPYWLDLALAYYGAGERDRQEQAILTAVAVDPTTPDVAWNAGNFFLVQNKLPQALHQFSVVLGNDPQRVRPALELCWRATHDVNTVQSLLPPDPAVYLQFLRLLISKNEWAGAYHVWSSLASMQQSFDVKQAIFYVDALLEHHDVSRAGEVWKQLSARSAELRSREAAEDMVFNGGFERSFLNGGFDWKYLKQPGSSVAMDGEAHNGRRSLAISYTGRNQDSGIVQLIPVSPATDYQLSGWVKSDNLKSGAGVCIAVLDAYDNSVLAQTPETLGTSDWHLVEAGFQTGPQTRLVAIRLIHAQGESWIEGQFWADDIDLRRVSTTPATLPH